MRRAGRLHRGLVGLTFLLATAVARATETSPQSVVDAVAAATLQPDRAVAVRGLDLDMALGSLHLEEGLLVPAKPIAGRTMELVFIGSASFRIVPPDPVEAQQLKLFSGHRELDTPVERAVLVVADDVVVAQLLAAGTPTTLPPDASSAAHERFQAWVSGNDRRTFGTRAAIVKAVFGGPAHAGYFAAWLETRDHGELFYVVDPESQEQVMLGQFKAMEIGDADRKRMERGIRREQREGRLTQFRFENLGDWDTWISSSLQTDGGPAPGSKGVEPKHYALDLRISLKDGNVRGKATLELTATASQRKTLELSLFSDLRVTAIRDGQDRPLYWHQLDDNVHVVLAEPTRANERLSLVVEYSGILLYEVEPGIHVARDTFAWYPRAGHIDRATYDLTFRWSGNSSVLASGRVVATGEANGLRWQRRTLDVPSLSAGFEIGDFKLTTVQVGHVEVTLAMSKTTLTKAPKVDREILDTLADALPFYEETFGDYPLDYLTVVTVPRGFSQGYLGFITLSHYLMGHLRQGAFARPEDAVEYRRETLVHELAHQWWGNKLGWHSYRDQWLSEALADFSAVTYVSRRVHKQSVYLARNAEEWRSALNLAAANGTSVESLGPVTLGQRLSSSLSDDAYYAVVYKKGSVVFSMLAQRLGPQELLGMLKALADRADGMVIETAVFLRALEHMSGMSLSDFAKQFIYGTGMPEIYYTFEFKRQDDGSWVIEGEAAQMYDPGRQYRVVQTERQTWRLAPTARDKIDVPSSVLVVPFQIAIAESDEKLPQWDRRMTTARGLGGQLTIEGDVNHFRIPVAQEPKNFWLDQRGEVLARFYAERRYPKRILRYRAMNSMLSGEADTAEELLRAAISAPTHVAEVSDRPLSKSEIADFTRWEDTAIQLGLAEIYLDTGRFAAAIEALDAADRLVSGPLYQLWYVASRDLLRARLELEQGDYKAAYRRLSRHVYLEFVQRYGEPIADTLRRRRFLEGTTTRREAYAMLALAAHETGETAVALKALEEAESRSVDMSALRSRL
jgi:hypothetical protein